MQQALDMIRRELGPDATVLHTRECHASLLGRIFLGRHFEVAASKDANVPARMVVTEEAAAASTSKPASNILAGDDFDYRNRYRNDFLADSGTEIDELQFMSQHLRQQSADSAIHKLPEALFEVYTDLIESDVEERVAQQLLHHLRANETVDLHDAFALRAELMRKIESEIEVTGPLQVTSGAGKVIALVGPTGVGKTTTIAKLAANFRLRENKSVGLITVDTYRIAAVEQLRTYADIIDLPMEVVSTPREMREAVARMKSMDLILMDTAGRSPRDQVRIQELKSILSEANPDEVFVVLSAVSGAKSLTTTAEKFASVGTTGIVVTKLDEAMALGNLLSIGQVSRLPISYVTDGQNVPDDIQVANSRKLAELILGIKN
ncbi:Flagellar biosynthesis protein FlhF [Bythopirellula goksoeyrii]|uniref:Flagellar biosynthesis protein FlhF n=2 Tax=Bythopirellula goksoeyrii TaxID=1400387 RepID=A0A5B9Q202_9BACT|nr:Flagellar biosynthesis protein FlhF [Bythopirellula goksoeyrii]